MKDNEKRPGEVSLPFDPAAEAGDASVVFIGRVRSAWKTRAECPRNMIQARQRERTAVIELDEAWREGLNGLKKATRIVVLYWMHEARRDLIVQKPNHKNEPTGVFALRSPVRPNPVAMATVRIEDIDRSAGRITIDAIDCLDGTPLLDIKPWLDAVDGAASSSVP